MPALVNSSVGSSSGTTLDDGTNVWPCFCTKKSMNCWRMSLADGIAVGSLRNIENRTLEYFTDHGRNRQRDGKVGSNKGSKNVQFTFSVCASFQAIVDGDACESLTL